MARCKRRSKALFRFAQARRSYRSKMASWLARLQVPRHILAGGEKLFKAHEVFDLADPAAFGVWQRIRITELLRDQAMTCATDAIEINVRGRRLAREVFEFRIGRSRGQELSEDFGIGRTMGIGPN
jgi:hypothetical protein